MTSSEGFSIMKMKVAFIIISLAVMKQYECLSVQHSSAIIVTGSGTSSVLPVHCEWTKS